MPRKKGQSSMGNTVVVGLQWGDEGKGKVTDLLAEHADVVVRYQGGSNAGHTVVYKGTTLKLHLVPSGILRPDVVCLMGDGMVVDPLVLAREINELEGMGICTAGLRISGNAHVIMPYHIRLDEVQERDRGASKIGTTKRGIGPAYCDKTSRMPESVRIWDLLDRDRLVERVTAQLELKNKIFVHVYGIKPMTIEEIVDPILEVVPLFADRVVDGRALLYEQMDRDARIVFEGAQGTFLDLNHGTFPYVTSSHPIAGGACIGVGIGPTAIDSVVGVAKAYTTRVGAGIFLTEQDNPDGDTIRERGHEYGTTTGRPRRCGWLDCMVLRTAVRINGVTAIAVTLLDVLDAFEKVPVCIGYELNGKRLEYVPSNQDELARCRPIYEELPGWQVPIGTCRTWEDLPANARNYLDAVSRWAGAPVGLVSVGADREQTIFLPALPLA
ncbi:MAG: adenylosuccinate synthase [Candidatus Zipacnadales bacterium]